jgi:prolyl-tRNA synthetase
MTKNIEHYDDLFLKTLREDPNDADTKGYKLLIRAGFIRSVGAGIFSWLPLGLKVLEKVKVIVNEEMRAIGAQEVLLPALIPSKPYEITNRFTEYGPNLFRLKDRKGSDYLLGPTHEELFTLLMKGMYSSYKDLPKILYQIQTKYRDEARPRAGLIRSREFIMKDSYSFDMTEDELKKSYELHRQAYLNIFKRVHLEVFPVSAQSGAMGGSRSEEFLHPNPIGEDTFITTKSGYSANVEAFKPLIPEPKDWATIAPMSKVSTPGTKTIEALCELLNIAAGQTLKSVVYTLVTPDNKRQLVVVGVRGDEEVDEKRLQAELEPNEIVDTTDEDFKHYPGIVPGFIGPSFQRTFNSPSVGLTESSSLRGANGDAAISGSEAPDSGAGGDQYLEPIYILDSTIVAGDSFVTGANERDQHLKDFVIGRDYIPGGNTAPEYKNDKVFGVKKVKEGDLAFNGEPVSILRGMEMGHIFELGQKYSKALGLEVLNEAGQLQTVWMGSYGVGISRIVAALAETYNDDFGLKWPEDLAPYDYYIIEANDSPEVKKLSEQLQEKIVAENKTALIDDRKKVSIGVKFKDSELLGIPKTLVIGKLAPEGKYELKNRTTGEKSEVEFR